MTGRSTAKEKILQGQQTLNARLGKNLKSEKSNRGRKSLRRGLAITLLLAAIVLAIIVSFVR